ncbi:sugar-binding protein [Cohnella fermenti]|nr:sugar-binding protein [Cohnella fermenti]
MPEPNMIANAGFESGLWPTRSGAGLDTTVKHSGDQSAVMIGGTASQYVGSSLIPIDAAEVYELSAWIKTDALSTDAAASVNVLMVDANNNALGWYRTMKLLQTGGTQDWTPYSTEISQFATGTAYLRVYVRLDGNATGTAWFDDAALNVARNRLPNAGFESGLWPTRSGAGLDTTVKHSGDQSAVMIGGTASQYVGSSLIPIDAAEVYELSAWIKTDALSTDAAASVNVLMVDANNSSLGWYRNTMKQIQTGGTQGWTNYRVVLDRLAAGTATVRIYVRLDANAEGTVWFDDISLKLKDFVIGVSGPTGNIVVPGESDGLSVVLKSAMPQSHSVQVVYAVSDTEGAGVANGSFTAVVPSGIPVQQALDLSGLERYGTYTLDLHVTGSGGGTADIDEEGSFPFSLAVPADSSEAFGTAIHLLGRTDAAYVDTYLSLIADSGIQWIRDDARWSAAETTMGQIDIPAAWDMYVNKAVAKGIKPLLIVDYGNPLYDGGNAPYTEEGIAAYAAYAGALAEHFAGKVDHFEIWNEWNIGGGNPEHLSPEAYATVLHAAYAAIKAANPNAFVIGGATSGADAAWIERVLEAGGYDDMDAVSIHPYMYPVGPEDGGFAASLTTIHNLFANYGPAKPIWVTEIGWPTNESLSRGVSERMSGVYAVQAYTLALSSGLADKVFWYDFKNDDKPSTSLEGHFGLVRGDHEAAPWSAKENYAAYRTLAAKLAGAAFVESYNAGDQVQAHRFHRNSDGKDVLVLWSKGDEKNLLLSLGTSAATAYDRFGNGTSLTAAGDGTITLPISQVPVYVEGSFASGIDIEDPYRIEAYPQLQRTSSGAYWQVAVQIDNQLDEAIAGTVQLSADSSPWSGQQSFAAAANGSATLTFDWPGTPEDRLYALDIQTELAGGAGVVVRRKMSFLAAPEASTSPVIDGSLSAGEWDDAFSFELDQASQAHLSDWGGTSDLSGTGYVRWDDDNFYLAVKAKDNTHVQSGSGSDIWGGDSIQFALQPGRKAGGAALGYNEIGLGLNPNSGAILWRWTAATRTANLSGAAYAVARDDSQATTVYELAIPWDALLPDGMTAAVGADFGFSLLINDNDGTGRRGWIEYMSGIGEVKNTDEFGDLLLIE